MNTNDLSEFGCRELEMAAKLLAGYINNPNVLGYDIKLEFNLDNGSVFLVDGDYEVAMMNGDKLEIWYNCPECGWEGFLEDMDQDNPKELEIWYNCPECGRECFLD